MKKNMFNTVKKGIIRSAALLLLAGFCGNISANFDDYLGRITKDDQYNDRINMEKIAALNKVGDIKVGDSITPVFVNLFQRHYDLSAALDNKQPEEANYKKQMEFFDILMKDQGGIDYKPKDDGDAEYIKGVFKALYAQTNVLQRALHFSDESKIKDLSVEEVSDINENVKNEFAKLNNLEEENQELKDQLDNVPPAIDLKTVSLDQLKDNNDVQNLLTQLEGINDLLIKFEVKDESGEEIKKEDITKVKENLQKVFDAITDVNKQFKLFKNSSKVLNPSDIVEGDIAELQHNVSRTLSTFATEFKTINEILKKQKLPGLEKIDIEDIAKTKENIRQAITIFNNELEDVNKQLATFEDFDKIKAEGMFVTKNNAKKVVDEYEKIIFDKNKIIEDLGNLSNNTKSTIDKLEAQKKEAEDAKTQLEAQIKQLENKLTKKQSTIEKSKLAVSTLEAQMANQDAQYNNNIVEYKNSIKEYEETIEEYTNEIKSLNDNIKELASNIEQYEAKIKLLSSQNQKLSTENELLRKDAANNLTALAKQQEKISILTEQLIQQGQSESSTVVKDSEEFDNAKTADSELYKDNDTYKPFSTNESDEDETNSPHASAYGSDSENDNKSLQDRENNTSDKQLSTLESDSDDDDVFFNKVMSKIKDNKQNNTTSSFTKGTFVELPKTQKPVTASKEVKEQMSKSSKAANSILPGINTEKQATIVTNIPSASAKSQKPLRQEPKSKSNANNPYGILPGINTEQGDYTTSYDDIILDLETDKGDDTETLNADNSYNIDTEKQITSGKTQQASKPKSNMTMTWEDKELE